MRKLRLFLLSILVMSGTGLWAQAVGDYGSAASGNWGTVGTWVVCATAGTWTGATVATVVPASTNNVWIRSGHTVTVDVSGKVCNNLTIDNGGLVKCTDALPTSSLRYLRVYGSTVTVNGQFGNSAKDELGIQPYNGATQVLTLTGTGVIYLCRIQPQTSGQSVIIDANTQFDYAGSAGTGSTSLYCANGDLTVTINSGKTVTFSDNSYFGVNTSSGSSAGTANLTLNLNGTLTASGANSCVNLNTASGKTVTLNIGSAGIMNVSGPIRANYLNAGTLNLNIANGGQINCLSTGTTLLSKSIISNNGSINIQSVTADSLGNTTVSSTGAITINKTSGNVAICSPSAINGNLTLTSGKLSLGANDLTIGSTGSISGISANNYIVTNGAGRLNQTVGSGVATLFPVGASATSYDPVTVTPNTTSSFAVRAYSTLSGSPVYGVRYNAKEWDITPATASSTLIALTPSNLVEAVTSPVIGHYVSGAYVNSNATMTNSNTTFTGTFDTFSPFVTGANIDVTALAQTKISDVSFDGQTILNPAHQSLRVYDATGRFVTSSTENINMSSRTKGIYMIKSQSGVLKIVI